MAARQIKDTIPPRDDDVLIRVDKQTAHELERICQEADMSVRETARWVTWLGRKAFGRKVLIKDGDKTLELSLEDFPKLSHKLDLS